MFSFGDLMVFGMFILALLTYIAKKKMTRLGRQPNGSFL